MDKGILNKIAQEWAKGILLATGMDSFSELDEEFSYEEQAYIVQQVHKIANKITKEKASGSLTQIIHKYYDFE